MRSSGWLGEGSSIPELDTPEAESDIALPSTEDVIRKTEQITKNIQELLRAAQENKHDRSVSKGQEPPPFSCLLFCHQPEPFQLCIFSTRNLSLHRYDDSGVTAPDLALLSAGRVSVKAHAGSGTAWDASALWSPGPRKQLLPSTRSASEPLTPPPGTLASVPASQAQCSLPLPHALGLTCVSPARPANKHFPLTLQTLTLFLKFFSGDKYAEWIFKVKVTQVIKEHLW